MQKWEYLVVRGEYGGFSRRFMPHFVNEQELKDWKKFFVFFNEPTWERRLGIGKFYRLSFR